MIEVIHCWEVLTIGYLKNWPLFDALPASQAGVKSRTSFGACYL